MNIQTFIDSPVDYSEAFTMRVAALSEKVAKECGLTTHHLRDMNYSAAQAISVSQSDVELRLYISSRGPLFALMRLVRTQGRWQRSDLGPTELSTIARCLRRVIVAAGYAEVPCHDWDSPAVGKKTELDGAPATIFDVLFTEAI